MYTSGPKSILYIRPFPYIYPHNPQIMSAICDTNQTLPLKMFKQASQSAIPHHTSHSECPEDLRIFILELLCQFWKTS